MLCCIHATYYQTYTKIFTLAPTTLCTHPGSPKDRKPQLQKRSTTLQHCQQSLAHSQPEITISSSVWQQKNIIYNNMVQTSKSTQTRMRLNQQSAPKHSFSLQLYIISSLYYYTTVYVTIQLGETVRNNSAFSKVVPFPNQCITTF